MLFLANVHRSTRRSFENLRLVETDSCLHFGGVDYFQSSRNSKVELEFATHGCAQTVEELTGLLAAQIALHITRIEVIGDVENRDADAHSTPLEFRDEFRYRETFNYLRIERKEIGETSRFIARSDELKSFVDE